MDKEPNNQGQDKIETIFQGLLRMFGLMRQVMEPFFTTFGISGPQWGVLRVLHRAELEGHKGLRSTDLGKRLLIRPPSVTGVIDRLGRMGLVDRRATAEDKRVRTLHLTDQGRKLVDRVLENYTEQIHSLFAGLTDRQGDNFQEILDGMRVHLTELVKQQNKSSAKESEDSGAI